jgi:hypothetical protein
MIAAAWGAACGLLAAGAWAVWHAIARRRRRGRHVGDWWGQGL